MQDTGIDLYEIYRWPQRKKLVYAQHYTAFDEAQREEADMDGADPSDLGADPSDYNIPSGSTPSMSGSAPSPSTSSTPKAGKTEKTNHPALRKYSKRVNVQNPEERMSQAEKDEIREKHQSKHGVDEGRTIDEIDGDGIDVFHSKGGSIEQAGDSVDE